MTKTPTGVKCPPLQPTAHRPTATTNWLEPSVSWATFLAPSRRQARPAGSSLRERAQGRWPRRACASARLLVNHAKAGPGVSPGLPLTTLTTSVYPSRADLRIHELHDGLRGVITGDNCHYRRSRAWIALQQPSNWPRLAATKCRVGRTPFPDGKGSGMHFEC